MSRLYIVHFEQYRYIGNIGQKKVFYVNYVHMWIGPFINYKWYNLGNNNFISAPEIIFRACLETMQSAGFTI